MSKSLKRVEKAISEAGLSIEVVKTKKAATTAAMAADSVGCHVDQIAKSIIFQGASSGQPYLFLTAGGNRVLPKRASTLASEGLGKADAATIRENTGFAIGGVSPLGHLTPITTYFDPRLMEFDVIWAAAGTPHHVFPIHPAELQKITRAKLGEFTA